MKLIGYTCTYNEAKLVKYVMPYVELVGYDKFIVYDNESTDNTVELLSKYPFVEIRTYSTNGVFNEYERANLHIKSLNECYEMIKNGEDVWFTWTDFDEVLFAESGLKNAIMHECTSGVYCTYFDGRILNLYPPKHQKTFNDIQKNITGLVHTFDGTLCEYWNTWGAKPSIFLLNAITEFSTFVPGNHVMYIKRNQIEPRNLNDYCTIQSFHLKYIDYDFLKKYVKDSYERNLDKGDFNEENFDKEYFMRKYGRTFPIEYYMALNTCSEKIGYEGFNIIN